MNGLSHVAVDARGWVYIADRFNDRVLVLDSSFKLRRVIDITDENGRGGPCRLCYSQDSGQLIFGLAVSESLDVSGGPGGRVDVFDVGTF